MSSPSQRSGKAQKAQPTFCASDSFSEQVETHLDMLVGASLGGDRGAVLQRPADEDLGRLLAQPPGNVGDQRRAQQGRDLLAVQHVCGGWPRGSHDMHSLFMRTHISTDHSTGDGLIRKYTLWQSKLLRFSNPHRILLHLSEIGSM